MSDNIIFVFIFQRQCEHFLHDLFIALKKKKGPDDSFQYPVPSLSRLYNNKIYI